MVVGRRRVAAASVATAYALYVCLCLDFFPLSSSSSHPLNHPHSHPSCYTLCVFSLRGVHSIYYLVYITEAKSTCIYATICIFVYEYVYSCNKCVSIYSVCARVVKTSLRPEKYSEEFLRVQTI